MASVLEEMNRRVAKTRAAKGGKAKAPARGVQDAFADVFNASNKAFAKAHEDAFGKMDSIVNHYAARRAPQAQAQPNSKKRKSDALGIGPAPGAKRKSSAAGARVISAGVRKKMGVPGAFGADEDNDNDNDNGDGDDDDSEEDPGDRRSSKRIRTTSGNDVHSGQRVSLAPPAGADPDAEDLKKQKEHEAICRKLDTNKARRCSSRGRVSIGGKPPAGKCSSFSRGSLSDWPYSFREGKDILLRVPCICQVPGAQCMEHGCRGVEGHQTCCAAVFYCSRREACTGTETCT